MADSFKVTDGTTEIELIYAAGSQEEYKLQYGTRVSVPEPAVLVHQPDDGESQPIRAVDRDREMYLTMNVPGDDWDAVIDAVTRLKRMVDGAHSQALRYWTIGDVDRVVLRVQKNGSANYTDLPIKWGFVDDSTAYYTSIQTEIGWQIVVMLVVAPYGEGAPITLRNDLASSPHFIEDSNSDGLADGWTLFGTSAALNTTRYLIGGQSQSLNVSASGSEYITSDVVSASAGLDAVGYIWICEPTETADPVSLRLLNGSSTLITSVTFNPSSPTGYDKTATGANGDTWYRYTVSGNNGGVTGFRLQVLRDGGAASATGTYYLDAAYLEIDQTVVPEAWCSTTSIENRHDPDSSNEDQINYIDIWGVPGDSPAMLSQSIQAGGSHAYLVVNRCRDATGSGDYYFAHIEGETTSVTSPDGGWALNQSVQSLSTASGGQYRRIEVPSTSENAFLSFSIGDYSEGFRAFMRARISNTALKIRMADNDYVEFNASSTWETIDLGYAPNDIARNAIGGGNDKLKLTIEPTSAGYYIDIDEFLVFPATTDGLLIVEWTGVLLLTIDSTYGVAYTSGAQTAPTLGSLYSILPAEPQRLVYMTYAADNSYDLDDTLDVTFTITPRTRHLLGAI
jgi:hypothetical protein